MDDLTYSPAYPQANLRVGQVIYPVQVGSVPNIGQVISLEHFPSIYVILNGLPKLA